MYVRPELQALRGNPASQRHAQAKLDQACKAWREDFPLDLLDREVAEYGKGMPCEDLPLLQGLFDPGDDSAERLCQGLIDRLASAAAAEPLGYVPFRHRCDEANAALVLSGSNGAALILQAIDGSALARATPARSANFLPGETWERILAGSAEADLIRLEGAENIHAELSSEPVRLEPGAIQRRQGNHEVLHLRRIEGQLVSIKLQRRIGHALFAREFLLASGELVHQSAGSLRDSRLELTVALLGRMGRSDAAPLLAAMAEEHGSTALRWQALREVIALDTAIGFATLGRLAKRSEDPLAAPAGALRVQLLQSYPELAGIDACPV